VTAEMRHVIERLQEMAAGKARRGGRGGLPGFLPPGSRRQASAEWLTVARRTRQPA
jgi:hypothetical protein